MKKILWRNPNTIELNALFIQPTRWCGLNCKGCYVKDHKDGEDSFHTSWQEQWRLFNQFYHGPHWANQITISVDDLPDEPNRRRHMLLLVDSILLETQKDKRPKNDRPEVHMTLHTLNTFRQYSKEGVKDWDGLSMISFSELPSVKPRPISAVDYFKALKIPINYNKLVHSTTNWDNEIEDLRNITKYVDHTYLVMTKRPIDSSKISTSTDHNFMSSYLLYISEVVDKLPIDVRSKISLDSCLSDTIKYSRTGFGCSANVSKFQVWPDGSVSGCPYAFSGGNEVGKSAEDIVGNINKAFQRYEFKENCHLPNVYSNVGKRPRLRVL